MRGYEMGFFFSFPLTVNKNSSLFTKAKEQNILWVDVPPFGFLSHSLVDPPARTSMSI